MVLEFIPSIARFHALHKGKIRFPAALWNRVLFILMQRLAVSPDVLIRCSPNSIQLFDSDHPPVFSAPLSYSSGGRLKYSGS